MKFRPYRLLPLLMLVWPSVSAAEPRPPTGSWYADFGEAQCIATRNYGTEENPLYLVLKLPPLGDVLQIGIARKGYTPHATQLDGEILFDGFPPVGTSLLEFGVRNLNQRMLLTNLPLERLGPMRSASSIRVRARQEIQAQSSRISAIDRVTDYHLRLTSVAQLMKTLGTCADGLRKKWNIEQAEGPPSLVRERPKGNLVGVIRNDDYPASAQVKGLSGSLKLAILVDERGRIADCTIIQTSRVAVLDAQSCAIVTQRARFRPAVGLDGKPAKGAVTQTISWMLED